MIACVYVVAFLLLITKIGDVVSTLQNIEGNNDETNPLANSLMRRLGIRRAVWVIFGISLLIIFIAAFAAIKGTFVSQALFVFVGLFISIVQAAVAKANWTRRPNFITRKAEALHEFMRKLYGMVK